jgi:hypothetical protein
MTKTPEARAEMDRFDIELQSTETGYTRGGIERALAYVRAGIGAVPAVGTLRIFNGSGFTAVSSLATILTEAHHAGA